MKKETVERFIWSKDEVRSLLLADLHSRGIEVEGESALSLAGMTVVLEFYPLERARMSTEKTLG